MPKSKYTRSAPTATSCGLRPASADRSSGWCTSLGTLVVDVFVSAAAGSSASDRGCTAVTGDIKKLRGSSTKQYRPRALRCGVGSAVRGCVGGLLVVCVELVGSCNDIRYFRPKGNLEIQVLFFVHRRTAHRRRRDDSCWHARARSGVHEQHHQFDESRPARQFRGRALGGLRLPLSRLGLVHQLHVR